LANATTLVRGDDQVGVDEFLARLVAGERLVVDGWLDTWRNVQVTAAFADADDPPPHDQKTEVVGEIVELQPEARQLVLQVNRIEKGGRDLPSRRPLLLDVRVDDRTRIKWVPRRARHRGHLEFDDLRAGMLVEVEWHGPSTPPVVAHKIDIRAEHAAPAIRVLHGTVREIDLAAGRVRLAAARDEPFRFGRDRYEAVDVLVDGETILLRKSDGRLREIDLPDVAPGDRAWVLGRHLEGPRLRALVMSVRRGDG
jgi:hypothetical protein